MKFQPEKLDAESIVQGYDQQGVIINGKRFSDSLFFGTDIQPTTWPCGNTAELNQEQANGLLDRCPKDMEVLLLGTGDKQVFPSIEVRRVFMQKQIPVEFMDSQAACRTYNILIGEGRKVIAALIMDKP